MNTRWWVACKGHQSVVWYFVQIGELIQNTWRRSRYSVILELTKICVRYPRRFLYLTETYIQFFSSSSEDVAQIFHENRPLSPVFKLAKSIKQILTLSSASLRPVGVTLQTPRNDLMTWWRFTFYINRWVSSVSVTLLGRQSTELRSGEKGKWCGNWATGRLR